MRGKCLVIILSVLCLTFGLPIEKPNSAPFINSIVQQPAEEWSPERDGVGDLTEAPPIIKAPKLRKPIPIVNRRFNLMEFARYVKYNVSNEISKPNHWRPSFIVLHNTWKPTIAQLPHGFNEKQMTGLSNFYGMKMGWRSGPAAFIDQNGIWVFSGFTAHGTHSPSWNRVSWGIEQLGDFEQEPYDTGDGKLIRDNAVAALAVLSIAANINIETLKLHKEDPKTTHNCPGSHCQKERVIEDVKREIGRWKKVWDTL